MIPASRLARFAYSRRANSSLRVIRLYAWAAVHVNCQESKLAIHDDKPKLRDLPKEMGGSGIEMTELTAAD